MKIYSRPLTDDEENEKYGENKKPINSFWIRNDNHYYKQRAYDVLHIKRDEVINTLHLGYLNEISNEIVEITENNFNIVLKSTKEYLNI